MPLLKCIESHHFKLDPNLNDLCANDQNYVYFGLEQIVCGRACYALTHSVIASVDTPNTWEYACRI